MLEAALKHGDLKVFFYIWEENFSWGLSHLSFVVEEMVKDYPGDVERVLKGKASKSIFFFLEAKEKVIFVKEILEMLNEGNFEDLAVLRYEPYAIALLYVISEPEYDSFKHFEFFSDCLLEITSLDLQEW